MREQVEETTATHVYLPVASKSYLEIWTSFGCVLEKGREKVMIHFGCAV